MAKMGFMDFYDIALYGNEMWKGSFTPEEVKQNAEIYYADFLWSKANDTISETIKSLVKNLADDIKAMPDLEEPKQWLYQIASELGLIDMDYNDYLDTDEWLANLDRREVIIWDYQEYQRKNSVQH